MVIPKQRAGVSGITEAAEEEEYSMEASKEEQDQVASRKWWYLKEHEISDCQHPTGL